jgi:hypothetical protein
MAQTDFINPYIPGILACANGFFRWHPLAQMTCASQRNGPKEIPLAHGVAPSEFLVGGPLAALAGKLRCVVVWWGVCGC